MIQPTAENITQGKEHVPVSLENEKDLEDVTDFVYVMCTIPGPGALNKSLMEERKGCDCQNEVKCNKSCECLMGYGPCYDDRGCLIIQNAHRSHHRPVYECNRHCLCSRDCTNRIVQKGITYKLQVYSTGKKGFALRTVDNIVKNSFVCEYAGEILTLKVAAQRTKTLSEQSSSNYYILAVKEHLGSGEVITTYVDPMYVGNVGRFINHSCEPNLYMVPVRINNSIPRIGLFAAQDIAAGEELTFSYGGDVSSSDEGDIPEVTANGETCKQDMRRRVCYCGTSSCKGLLPFDTSLYN